MITEKELAKMVSKRILEVNRLLNELAVIVAEKAPPDEEKRFRHAIGAVSAELLLSVANPLYRQHPALKPVEMG